MRQSASPAYISIASAGKNGKHSLPFLAAFATHNATCHVADPGNPPSIQPSRDSSPRSKSKSGKNGNVDWHGQHCPGHCGQLSLSYHAVSSPPPRSPRHLRFNLLAPSVNLPSLRSSVFVLVSPLSSLLLPSATSATSATSAVQFVSLPPHSAQRGALEARLRPQIARHQRHQRSEERRVGKECR